MGRIQLSLLAATALAGAIVGGTAAAKDGSKVLTPSSKWNVDFAPNKCRLSRAFGEGKDRHLLFFEQYAPDARAGMTIAGPAVARFRSLKRTKLSFFDGQEPMRTEPFVGNVEGYGSAVIYSSVSLEHGTEGSDEESSVLPQLDTAFAAKATRVTLKQGGQTVHLKTGPLNEAFAVLNQCTQSLVEDWGLDPAKHLTAIKLPHWKNKDSVARRIASKYPGAALSRGEQGIMRMRVNVDKSGKVTECVINEATTADRLESPACREMSKAKFSPAIDANGKAFESFYATSIIYRMGR